MTTPAATAAAIASGKGATVGDRAAPAWSIVRRLFAFHGWIFWGTALTYALLYCLNIVPGLLVRQLFNTLTRGSQLGFGPWELIALLAVTQLVSAGTFWLFVAAEATYRHVHYALVRRNVFQRILEQPGARALPGSTGDALSRLRGDVDAIYALHSAAYNVVGYTAFVAVALVIMLRVNALITATVFLPMLGVALIANLASKRIVRYRQGSREAGGRVSDALGEMFGAVQAIKVADAERPVIAHFRALADARRRAALKERLFDEILRSVWNNLTDLGAGLVLLVAAHAVRGGGFTVGDFALFLFFLGWISGLTSFLGIVYARFKQVGVSFRRLADLLQGAPPEVIATPGPIYLRGELPPVPYVPRGPQHRLEALEVRGLGFQYPGAARPAVDGASFALRPGTLTVVTRRLGAG